jgi:large subunit ribosomal protein L31e
MRQKLKKYPRWQRTKKSVKYLRNFLSRHMKTSPESIKFDTKLNEKLWERGAEKPPGKIKVRAVKFDDGIVEVEIAE